jgi:hypothetical protein
MVTEIEEEYTGTYWFAIKYNSGKDRWKRGLGQGIELGKKVHAPSAGHHLLSNNREAL